MTRWKKVISTLLAAAMVTALMSTAALAAPASYRVDDDTFMIHIRVDLSDVVSESTGRLSSGSYPFEVPLYTVRPGTVLTPVDTTVYIYSTVKEGGGVYAQDGAYLLRAGTSVSGTNQITIPADYSGMYVGHFGDAEGYYFLLDVINDAPAQTEQPAEQPADTQPAAEQPSGWAQGYVTEAVAANIVPEALQSKYTQPATRAEFCALAVQLYETVTGKTVEERVTFNDTDNENVEKAAALGVISGVGGGRANPDGNINRDQAAVMLASLARACGKPLEEKDHTFSDQDIDGWAAAAIGQVQNAGIMSGTGAGTFSPQAQYTREQSITTMLALYKYVK